ncbi:MAG: S8 family serine peptidase [Phycisphaerae bacterium]|jgi:subtilisin family serine protease
MNTHMQGSVLPCLVVLACLAGSVAGGQIASPSASPATADLHPALIQRFAEADGPVKAWIFFTDKGVAPGRDMAAALDRVAATYDRHAIERRLLRGSPAKQAGQVFDEHDLPVSADYIAAVTAAGADIHVTSRWLNAVSAWVTLDQAREIAALPCVSRLEPVRRFRHTDPIDVTPVAPGQPSPVDPARAGRLDYGDATQQLEQMDLIRLHDDGFTGQGIIIGVLDTGFERSHAAFNYPGHPLQVIAEHDFVDNDGNTGIQPGDAPEQHEHGTLILGCLGAYQPGVIVGGAYDAAYVLAKTEDPTGEYPAEEDDYVAGIEYVEAQGVDISTASLGYIDWYTQEDLDGLTAACTIAVNLLTANGVIHCNAAGNEGHDTNPQTSSLIAPADAFQVITCGAVQTNGRMADFSSDGPTADGRVKPELLALGVNTFSVDPYAPDGVTTASGTSLSTPLVAAAVACVLQARPEWTVDQMRAELFQTASQYVAMETFDPLYVQGYGIINAYAPLQDCNVNDVPDILDIARGDSGDCHRNGVPDECELAAGTSFDCNGNDVPDECDVAEIPAQVVEDGPFVLGWQEIATTGTTVSLWDNGTADVVMPFTNDVFPNSAVRIGNDGAIGFAAAFGLYFNNQEMPTDSLYYPGALSLAPYWDDLSANTGRVCYATIGTAPHRTFIVEWYDRRHWPGTGDGATFQVQIFETPVDGAFAQFLYLDVNFGDPAIDVGASATIGFQFDSGSGHMWSYNQHGAVEDGVVLSLMLPQDPLSPDQNGNGVPDECEGLAGDLNCDGVIDNFDIAPFVRLLTSTPPDYPEYYAGWPNCNHLNGDLNQDGAVDNFDIGPFVSLVANP